MSRFARPTKANMLGPFFDMTVVNANGAKIRDIFEWSESDELGGV